MTSIFKTIGGFFSRIWGAIVGRVHKELAALEGRVQALEQKAVTSTSQKVDEISTKING